MPYASVGYKHQVVYVFSVFVLLGEGGGILAGLPSLGRVGGEGEALLTIKVVYGEEHRKAMLTGLQKNPTHFLKTL